MKPIAFEFDGKIYKISKSSPQGAYSYYIKISPKKGIKILAKKSNFKTLKSLMSSGFKRQASREFNLLHLLSKKTNITPKGERIVYLKDLNSKKVYIGILMDHVQGKSLVKLYNKNPKRRYSFNGKKYLASNLRNHLERFLKTKGVFHRDLHFNNIFVTDSGKVKVIDFGLAHRISK